MKETKQERKQTKRDAVLLEEPKGASKPISLRPLSFDEALEGLLGVKPEPKKETNAKGRTKKKS